jgi:hypothetical protein
MSGLAQVLAHHRAVRSERCSTALDVAQVLDDGAAVELAGSRAWSRSALACP